MRTKAKVDRNQPEIVAALRAAGCSVRITSMLGKGYPDLTCGRAGQTFLLEVKDWQLPPSRKQLTADERQFFDEWRGHVARVETVEEALAAVGL